jgi:hypothetical protein
MAAFAPAPLDVARLVDRLDAAAAAERVRAVSALLDEAERTAARDGATPAEVLAVLARARLASPHAYREARERVARVAARLYRLPGGGDEARAALASVRELGPIADPSFHAAWRDARIAWARRLAARDVDAGVAWLCDGARVPADEGERAAALGLLLDELDARIARHDRRGAEATLARVRRFGAAPEQLAPREQKLRLLRLANPAVAGGLAVGVAIVVALFLVQRRRRPA